MNKKILISLSVIAAIAALAIGGTIAYFSDTETSTGNTFTAGKLDLIVDIDGVVYNPLNRTIFGPLTDIKPGDDGEETISLHVDNDACGFVKFDLTSDLDNSCTEPEAVEEGQGCPIGGPEGELNDLMVWSIWNDEGNVEGWQCSDGEGYPIQPCTADPEEGDNILNGEYEEVLVSGPLTGDVEYAFGLMPASNVLYYGFAWELPGSVTNIAQTDSFTADMILRAEQQRNQYPNGCPVGEWPQGPQG